MRPDCQLVPGGIEEVESSAARKLERLSVDRSACGDDGFAGCGEVIGVEDHKGTASWSRIALFQPSDLAVARAVDARVARSISGEGPAERLAIEAHGLAKVGDDEFDVVDSVVLARGHATEVSTTNLSRARLEIVVGGSLGCPPLVVDIGCTSFGCCRGPVGLRPHERGGVPCGSLTIPCLRVSADAFKQSRVARFLYQSSYLTQAVQTATRS